MESGYENDDDDDDDKLEGLSKRLASSNVVTGFFAQLMALEMTCLSGIMSLDIVRGRMR